LNQYVTMFKCGVACFTRSHLSVKCAVESCKFGGVTLRSEIQQFVSKRGITFMKNKALWKTEISCYGSPSILPWVRELKTADVWKQQTKPRLVRDHAAILDTIVNLLRTNLNYRQKVWN